MSFWSRSGRHPLCKESELHVSNLLVQGCSTIGRVTTFSLLYMHNLRLPLFAQYDMPEQYDLARTSMLPTNRAVLNPAFISRYFNIHLMLARD